MSDPYSHQPHSSQQYAQPGYYGQTPQPQSASDWRPPSGKTAALLMVIYGVLALVALAVGALLGWDQMQEAMDEVRQEAAGDPEMARFVEAGAIGGIACVFGCMALFSIAYLVLAYFVNRGARAAMITTVVLAIISVLFTLLSLLGTAYSIASPDEQVSAAVIGWSLGTDLVGLLLLAGILIYCFKALGEVAEMRNALAYQQQAHMQQQWHEYQQQQYAQQQGQAPPAEGGYSQDASDYPPPAGGSGEGGPDDEQRGWGR